MNKLIMNILYTLGFVSVCCAVTAVASGFIFLCIFLYKTGGWWLSGPVAAVLISIIIGLIITIEEWITE